MIHPKYESKNAVIESAELSNGDRGCLTGWLQLDYGDSGHQCFGGLALYLPKGWKYHELRGPAGHWIFRVMEIAGVKHWAELKGKTIRVRASDTGVQAIGHIVNEDWFEPDLDFRPEDTVMPDVTEQEEKK